MSTTSFLTHLMAAYIAAESPHPFALQMEERSYRAHKH
jgi:hypothetical protein